MSVTQPTSLNYRNQSHLLILLGTTLFILLFLGACSTQPTNNVAKPQQKITIAFSPLTDWVERRFSRSTEYHVEKRNNLTVLSANSNDSASLLYKKIHIDLNQTPYLSWQWLVEQTYVNNLNEQVKLGDDFPARIYIAIKPGLGQIKPRALTYVWASNAKQFSHWKNPFTNNVEVFALQSGNILTNKWITEKRNLKKDLSEFFGQSIESIEGIGIMTDSDNSNTFGKAAYANVFFSHD